MLNKIKKMDISIVVILLLFMVISTMLVHSADVDDSRITIGIKKSLIIYAIGFSAFFSMSLFDYKLLLKISTYLYITGIALLVAVYQFGTKINGARGWFTLPADLLFQPAELVKLILIITITAWLARKNGERLDLVKDVIPTGIMVIIAFVLVLIQPDLGNAIIYLIIMLGMLWIGNMKYTHVLIGTGLIIGGLFFFLFVFQHYHESIVAFLDSKGFGHWASRIDTFLDPQSASRDAKFQVDNSIRAIGSGSLTGEGYLNGSSVHSNFIPFAYSDSIFVIVGEEFGFRGAAVLLLLYFILIYRMILIAIQSVHISGSYLIVGVVSMFVFQIFENIGMMIGLMPLTGITLPFISYGGTSLMINMLSLGMVMSVRVHQDKPLSF